jgi:NADH:ubiquinone oxidoreductase subunit H
MFIVSLVCLIRTTLNRFKFDELMINAWIIILPVIFSFGILLFIR